MNQIWPIGTEIWFRTDKKLGCIIIAYTKKKGNNSSVKGSILMNHIRYQESMVLIICTKNEANLTNRYWDMVPDGQKVRMDGMDRRTDDTKTISLRLRRGIIKDGCWQPYLLQILSQNHRYTSWPPGILPMQVSEKFTQGSWRFVCSCWFLPVVRLKKGRGVKGAAITRFTDGWMDACQRLHLRQDKLYSW